MGVDIAEDAAAAVEEHQRRQRPSGGSLRGVDAVGQRPAGTRQFAVRGRADRHALEVDRPRQAPETFAHLLRRHRRDVGHAAGGGQHVEQPLGGRIERHDELPETANAA